MWRCSMITASLGVLLGCGRLDMRMLVPRSEEHTSELQSQSNLVCRLLLEKNHRRSRRQRPHGYGRMKVSVLEAAVYVFDELLRLVLLHQELELLQTTSRRLCRLTIRDAHP